MLCPKCQQDSGISDRDELSEDGEPIRVLECPDCGWREVYERGASP